MVIVGALSTPPVELRQPAEAAQATSAVDPTPCITDVVVIPAPSAPLEPGSGPSSEPLVRLDLAQDVTSGGGTTQPIELVRSGAVDHRPGVGATFAGEMDGISSAEPVDDLLAEIRSAQRFSVDVWLALEDLNQSGPARIVALAGGTTRTESNFHLGAEGDQLSVRMRTECNDTNWMLVDSLTDEPTHLALTYDRGEVSVYIDGAPRLRYRLVDADLESWLPSVPLTIGNEATLNRPLRGTVSVVTFWAGALTDGDVAALARVPDRRDSLRN